MINIYEPRAPTRSGPKRALNSARHFKPSGGVTIETKVGRRITPQPNGCWLWDGNGTRYGNTVLSSGGHQTRVKAHRFVYETLVGPIPEGHHLHHECETPGCCNPAHLTPLTPAEHIAQHPRRRARSVTT